MINPRPKIFLFILPEQRNLPSPIHCRKWWRYHGGEIGNGEHRQHWPDAWVGLGWLSRQRHRPPEDHPLGEQFQHRRLGHDCGLFWLCCPHFNWSVLVRIWYRHCNGSGNITIVFISIHDIFKSCCNLSRSTYVKCLLLIVEGCTAHLVHLASGM